MKKVPEVGDLIVLKEFAFTNKYGGGTGMSKKFGTTAWNPEYLKPVTVKVTKEWEDYECGQRGWATPLSSDKKLLAYLKENAKSTTIYWSEFDIIDVK